MTWSTINRPFQSSIQSLNTRPFENRTVTVFRLLLYNICCGFRPEPGLLTDCPDVLNFPVSSRPGFMFPPSLSLGSLRRRCSRLELRLELDPKKAQSRLAKFVFRPNRKKASILRREDGSNLQFMPDGSRSGPGWPK